MTIEARYEGLRDIAREACAAILEACEDNFATKFRCVEADDVAALFVAVGMAEEAEIWLDYHCEGDDDEMDDHPPCMECGVKQARDHGMCAECLHDARRSGWEPGENGER